MTEAALLAALPHWAWGFALLLARTGCACMMIPLLGEAELPATVRAGFAVALVAVLLPVLAPSLPAAPSQPLPAAAMVAAEVLTGLFLGWLSRLALLALSLAGQVIALLTGQSSVIQPDPSLGANTAALGRLFSVAAPVLLLTTPLHTLPLLALAGSYGVIPAGALLPAGDTLQTVVAAVGAMFALAVRLASPFLLLGLGWQLALALLTRVAPQAQVTQAAGPVPLLLGLLLLALLATPMLAAWQDRAGAVLAALPGL